MTEHEAFVRAVCESPFDDTPRLIFADWLEERGDYARSEFIRVQCEIAEIYLQVTDSRDNLNPPLGWSIPEETHSRMDLLRRRELELLEAHGSVWRWDFALAVTQPVPTDPGAAYRAGGLAMRLHKDARFRRGFVAHVTLDSQTFLAHARELALAAPLERITLADREPDYLVDGWVWYEGRRKFVKRRRTVIQTDVFRSMPGARRVFVKHPTEQAAREVLSAGCVAYARKRAGLPALDIKAKKVLA
jgi:uncharacterized protein (TIGR02996 family)